MSLWAITSSMLCEMDRKQLIQGLIWGFMAVVFNSVKPSCETEYITFTTYTDLFPIVS